MARRKSSLDMDEPIVVQGEMEEPTTEVAVGKADEKSAVTEKKKAETQKKTAENNKSEGVKICVF